MNVACVVNIKKKLGLASQESLFDIELDDVDNLLTLQAFYRLRVFLVSDFSFNQRSETTY